MSTPDYHADLVAKIIALDAADFPSGTVFALAEDPPGGAVLEAGTWVKSMGETAEQYDDVAVRSVRFQIKHRFDVATDTKGAAALAKVAALYDAVKGSGGLGPFTINSHDYLDLAALGPPQLREQNYVVLDLALDFYFSFG